jgi:cobalt-zinc-cadmium efflux system outer membrane protein
MRRSGTLPPPASPRGARQTRLGLALLGVLGVTSPLAAQRPVTLSDAIAAAQENAPQLALARADSAAARAGVGIARELPDPDLSLDYSRSVPTYHVIVEQPIDYPWLRSPRIRAAETAAGASRLTMAAARAAVRYQVELAYARAAGAAAIESLSRQDVANGEELVRSVRQRQAAGDVSDLDVELAEVTLGQLRNLALSDSLDALTAALRLQSLMGLPIDDVTIIVADSLGAVPAGPAAGDSALNVAAARAQLAAQEARLLLARRSRYPAPSLRAGFEEGDPDEPGLLPTFGVSIPIPLFSHGGAEVEQARAAADRARAELAAAERETELALATARREREVATARLAVDRAMVQDARRVAALSLTAYREGAYPLATVLEAQRNARDAQRQYLQDLMTSRGAEAAYRLATTAGGATP